MSSRTRACWGSNPLIALTQHARLNTLRNLCADIVPSTRWAVGYPYMLHQLQPCTALSRYLSYLGDTGTCRSRLPWSSTTHLKTDPCCITAWTLHQPKVSPSPSLHQSVFHSSTATICCQPSSSMLTLCNTWVKPATNLWHCMLQAPHPAQHLCQLFADP